MLAYTFANPDRAGGAAAASFAVRAARYRRGQRRAAPGRRSGERPLREQRLLLVRPAPDDRLDRRLRHPGQGADRVVADPLHHRLLVAGVHRVDRPVHPRPALAGRLQRRAARPPPPPWSRWSFWQYSESGYLPGIGWTDLDVFQSASGLPSLRPAADPKPRHRHKRRPKHQPKHEKPKSPKQAEEAQAKTEEAQSETESASNYSVTSHQFYPHSHQSRLISSAGDSAQASPRHRGYLAHPCDRRRPRARGRGADRREGIGRARGDHPAPSRAPTSPT